MPPPAAKSHIAPVALLSHSMQTPKRHNLSQGPSPTRCQCPTLCYLPDTPGPGHLGGPSQQDETWWALECPLSRFSCHWAGRHPSPTRSGLTLPECCPIAQASAKTHLGCHGVLGSAMSSCLQAVVQGLPSSLTSCWIPRSRAPPTNHWSHVTQCRWDLQLQSPIEGCPQPSIEGVDVLCLLLPLFEQNMSSKFARDCQSNTKSRTFPWHRCMPAHSIRHGPLHIPKKPSHGDRQNLDGTSQSALHPHDRSHHHRASS